MPVSSDGSVLPIEVKSNKDYKLRTALSNLPGTAEYGIGRATLVARRGFPGSTTMKLVCFGQRRAQSPVT